MITRAFTTAAFALVLSASLATAQEETTRQAMPAGTTGAAAATQAQPGAAGQQSQMNMSGQAADATFTDAKTFVKQELQEQEIVTDIYRMAEDKAQNDAVKQVAQKALKDHSQAKDKLKNIAKEIKVEAEKDQAQAAADPHVRHASQMKQQLQNLSGREFDRAFLSGVIEMHQKEIARYQAASNQAQQPEVKQFAENTLPALQQHLQAAQSAFQQVTGTAWTPTTQSGFTPTAAYQTQPGQQPSATQPGQQPSAAQPGMNPDTEARPASPGTNQ